MLEEGGAASTPANPVSTPAFTSTRSSNASPSSYGNSSEACNNSGARDSTGESLMSALWSFNLSASSGEFVANAVSHAARPAAPGQALGLRLLRRTGEVMCAVLDPSDLAPVLRMPDIHSMVDAQYSSYDVGVMGELDVRILTELFGGREMAQALSPEWAGGVYWAGQKKSSTTSEKETTASLGLLYYSQWKNDDSARSFLRVYTGELARKYSKLERRTNEEQSGEQVYSTNEGDVLISMSGKTVFVGEGFDLALSRKLRDAMKSAQGGGATMTAGMHEPSLSMAQELAGFGMMKAALR